MSKKRDMEPADWQERHSPTEPIETRVTAERKIARTRRRKADARIFDNLLEDQQQAMVEINDAFNDITGHVGASIMMYEERVSRTTGDRSQRRDILRRTYIEWAELGLRGKFNHAAALDIIVFGKGLREVETERRKAHGFAKDNLVDALDCWCEVRGWKRAL